MCPLAPGSITEAPHCKHNGLTGPVMMSALGNDQRKSSLKQSRQGKLLHFDVKEMWWKWVREGRKWRWKYDYKSGTIVRDVRTSPSLSLQTTSEMFHDLESIFIKQLMHFWKRSSEDAGGISTAMSLLLPRACGTINNKCSCYTCSFSEGACILAVGRRPGLWVTVFLLRNSKRASHVYMYAYPFPKSFTGVSVKKINDRFLWKSAWTCIEGPSILTVFSPI
jgi:hypothetical protein